MKFVELVEVQNSAKEKRKTLEEPQKNNRLLHRRKSLPATLKKKFGSKQALDGTGEI